jgi:hypothetical protein
MYRILCLIVIIYVKFGAGYNFQHLQWNTRKILYFCNSQYVDITVKLFRSVPFSWPKHF